MDIAKHFKRMVLEQECALDPALEYRVLNDELTERDIAFMTQGYENMMELRKLLNQSEGGIT